MMRPWAACHSTTTSASVRLPTACRTITTTSTASGQNSRVARKASLTRRLARFRSTALPTRREAVIPIRGPSARSLARIKKMKPDEITRCPESWMRRKSERFRTRLRAEKRPLGPLTGVTEAGITERGVTEAEVTWLDHSSPTGKARRLARAATSCCYPSRPGASAHADGDSSERRARLGFSTACENRACATGWCCEADRCVS